MYSMGNMINKKSSFFLFNLSACFVHSPSGCWGHSSRERSQADLYPSGAFSPPERINTETHPGPRYDQVLRKEARWERWGWVLEPGPWGAFRRRQPRAEWELSPGFSQAWRKVWGTSSIFFNTPFHIKNYLLEEDFLKIFIYLHQVLIAACQIFCFARGLLSSCGSWA